MKFFIFLISQSFLEANRRDGRLEDRRVYDAVWLSIERSAEGSVHVCCSASGVQWNLRTRDTLGLVVLSLVERLSLSRR